MKTLLFARDPGAADIVGSIAAAIPDECLILGKDYAYDVFKNKGLSCINFNDHFADKRLGFQDEALIASCLNTLNPDVIITGTAHYDDVTDRLLWQLASKRKIPTVAVLDQWIHVKERFCIEEHKITPDYVLVPNQSVKDIVKENTLAKEGAYIIGNPHLYDIVKDISSHRMHVPEMREALERKAGGTIEKLILFVSEPHRKLSKESLYGSYSGKDEIAWYHLLEKAIAQSAYKDALLFVKLHPKEDGSEYEGISEFLLKDEFDKHRLLMAADLIVGMRSTLLIEATLLGCPVLSIESDTEELAIINQHNLCLRASSLNEITKHINRVFDGTANITSSEEACRVLSVDADWGLALQELYHDITSKWFSI